MFVESVQPTVVELECLITSADFPTLSPLGLAVRNYIDFERGWDKCKRYEPVASCLNNHEERGWWAFLDAETAGHEFLTGGAQ